MENQNLQKTTQTFKILNHGIKNQKEVKLKKNGQAPSEQEKVTAFILSQGLTNGNLAKVALLTQKQVLSNLYAHR
jgi:hypothetical protein